MGGDSPALRRGAVEPSEASSAARRRSRKPDEQPQRTAGSPEPLQLPPATRPPRRAGTPRPVSRVRTAAARTETTCRRPDDATVANGVGAGHHRPRREAHHDPRSCAGARRSGGTRPAPLPRSPPRPSGLRRRDATTSTNGARHATKDRFEDLKESVHAELLQELGPQLYDANLDADELESKVRGVLADVLATHQPAADPCRP